jgi:hypothetical protein
MFKRSGTGIGNKLWAGIAVGVLLLAAIGFTQLSRIKSGAAGQDASLQGRITFPLEFLASHPDQVILGMGITPQDQVETYTLMLKAMTSNSAYMPGITEAISSTIVLLAGAGVAGIVLFVFLMFLFQRSSGVWLVVGFLVSNFINSGYNAPSTIIPTALLLSVMVYQSRLAREARAQLRMDPELVGSTA